jgi:hypothetical protein
MLIAERDEYAAPFVGSQDLRVVALPGGVVEQEYRPGAETAAFAIAGRQLKNTGEGCAELTPRSWVPRPRPAWRKASEHELFCRDAISQVDNRAAGNKVRRY